MFHIDDVFHAIKRNPSTNQFSPLSLTAHASNWDKRIGVSWRSSTLWWTCLSTLHHRIEDVVHNSSFRDLRDFFFSDRPLRYSTCKWKTSERVSAELPIFFYFPFTFFYALSFVPSLPSLTRSFFSTISTTSLHSIQSAFLFSSLVKTIFSLVFVSSNAECIRVAKIEKIFYKIIIFHLIRFG